MLSLVSVVVVLGSISHTIALAACACQPFSLIYFYALSLVFLLVFALTISSLSASISRLAAGGGGQLINDLNQPQLSKPCFFIVRLSVVV